MSDASPETETASGVQALIDRLRDQGVSAGRSEADRLVAEAKAEADRIRAAARTDADAIRQKAAAEADRMRASAEEAVQLAARDTVLDLKNRLTGAFRERLVRLVGHELSKPEVLRALILEVAGASLPEAAKDQRMEIVLPGEAVGLDALRRDPEQAGAGPLATTAFDIAAELLRDGVVLIPAADRDRTGITVRLVEQEIEIDLDDRAIGEVLLRHLLPRFRALLEGVIR